MATTRTPACWSRHRGAELIALVSSLASPTASAQLSDAIFADGFELPCPGAAPGVSSGIGSALLLRGTVVTPIVAFVGEVLVQGDTIACAAASCAGQPGADTATIVETQGIIFPGLIDTHNNILFDVFDENDWTPLQDVYPNHYTWTSEAQYGALVDAKQYLNGEGSSAVDYGCEMDKFGELKALLAGTTSIVGNPTPANKSCYGSLARTIDQSPNDLGADYIQVSILFPGTASADQVCANFADDSTHAYLVNIGEGTDATALDEFAHLGTVTTADGCLYAPQTAIVHGTALGATEFTSMGSAGMSLVWTPQSDVALYGQTADVPLAIAKNINVSLGTSWSATGSHNLLAALRFADQVDDGSWGGTLSAHDLVQMVTINAAKTLHLDAVLGSIDAGKKADLAVVAGTCSDPWSALVHARPRDVRLVLVGGVPLYGDASVQAAAPASPGCEALDVCGVPKFACVAESGGTVSNKFGQTLADIVGNLTAGFADYDALNLTQWTFSPVTPLVDCP
ncbi:MAG TPA: amidohydrolase family protein [Rudaea sp.]|nr:amidohydrolase family protein [Rudaea sp.]